MSKLGQWLQVGANIGILAGLVLVALQIQQNSELTRAALFSQHQEAWSNIDRSLQSEEFSVTLAKADAEPEGLTDAEMLEMHGYLYSHMEQFLRLYLLHQQGIFKAHPEVMMGYRVPRIFGNRFGAAWWAENKGNFNSEIVQMIDSSINDIGIAGYQLDRIRARLREDTSD